MSKRIDDYLAGLEEKVLNGDRDSIVISRTWPSRFTSEAGVYVVREEGEICYVGESVNLKKRMADLLDSRNHSLRRKIGSVKFAARDGWEKATPSRKFPLEFEEELDRLFEDNFEVSVLAVPIGRKELEERIIEKYSPKYNSREKRKSEESEKTYTVEEIRKQHGNAYKSWSPEEDEELELLEKEGMSLGELALKFGRKRGAITARVNKIKERK